MEGRGSTTQHEQQLLRAVRQSLQGLSLLLENISQDFEILATNYDECAKANEGWNRLLYQAAKK